MPPTVALALAVAVAVAVALALTLTRTRLELCEAYRCRAGRPKVQKGRELTPTLTLTVALAR